MQLFLPINLRISEQTNSNNQLLMSLYICEILTERKKLEGKNILYFFSIKRRTKKDYEREPLQQNAGVFISIKQKREREKN
jgi:hypothetical protein